jgi:hypothetical protein
MGRCIQGCQREDEHHDQVEKWESGHAERDDAAEKSNRMRRKQRGECEEERGLKGRCARNCGLTVYELISY